MALSRHWAGGLFARAAEYAHDCAALDGRAAAGNRIAAADRCGLADADAAYFLCGGVLESILVVGERGRVTLTDDGKWLNLRTGPGTDFNVIAQMAPLHDFLVLDGVRCSGPYAWYQVDYRGIVGWIAEGFEGQYFAAPWLPG